MFEKGVSVVLECRKFVRRGANFGTGDTAGPRGEVLGRTTTKSCWGLVAVLGVR